MPHCLFLALFKYIQSIVFHLWTFLSLKVFPPSLRERKKFVLPSLREKKISLSSLREKGSHASLVKRPFSLFSSSFSKAAIAPITSLVKRQNFESLFFIFSPPKKMKIASQNFISKKFANQKNQDVKKSKFFFSLLTSSLFLFFWYFFYFFYFFQKKNFFYFFCIFY